MQNGCYEKTHYISPVVNTVIITDLSTEIKEKTIWQA
jgi:hypothetical protein